MPRPVTGQEAVGLRKSEFLARFRQRFADPAFGPLAAEVAALAEAAWQAYRADRRSPRTRRAGRGFAQPDAKLPVEWLETRRRIRAAERRRRDPRSPSRVLVVNASPRSDQSCPGEASKSWRLARHACGVLQGIRRFEVDFLDLSRLASEYGLAILPCKGCVSTAPPLCHWPCSCYPNHGQGQAVDWMNDLYPRWTAAHGVLLVSPVHWYQAPSVLKLLMDRLVCADGGNPDPTTTRGKDASAAKRLELDGWSYPKHLAGRAFAVVVHGDAAGAGVLRRSLADWLTDLGMVPATPQGGIDRYVGYLRPYATSHRDLDGDAALWEEVRQVAVRLADAVVRLRGEGTPGPALREPRPK